MDISDAGVIAGQPQRSSTMKSLLGKFAFVICSAFLLAVAAGSQVAAAVRQNPGAALKKVQLAPMAECTPSDFQC